MARKMHSIKTAIPIMKLLNDIHPPPRKSLTAIYVKAVIIGVTKSITIKFIGDAIVQLANDENTDKKLIPPKVKKFISGYCDTAKPVIKTMNPKNTDIVNMKATSVNPFILTTTCTRPHSFSYDIPGNYCKDYKKPNRKPTRKSEHKYQTTGHNFRGPGIV